jgi:hypothetical protein
MLGSFVKISAPFRNESGDICCMRAELMEVSNDFRYNFFAQKTLLKKLYLLSREAQAMV